MESETTLTQDGSCPESRVARVRITSERALNDPSPWTPSTSHEETLIPIGKPLSSENRGYDHFPLVSEEERRFVMASYFDGRGQLYTVDNDAGYGTVRPGDRKLRN
ncbi:uncharacterized protein BJX67DRAFT_379422 [Aspergillus lucknowensis]|uniref:Uncharacterized protein n=1 Tax=Aspergillus lucknowensis TaxID=176173 RepID=A0ABR4LWL2_9EURO